MDKRKEFYYPINEDAAKRAKEMNSFSDYRPGSATEEYRRCVDEATALAERQKCRVDPIYHEKIDRLLDTYARKLASLESAQEKMKAVNTYYRKHKTLDGCPDISEDVLSKLKSDMESSWRTDEKPYPSWALSNNNAEIRRVKERIASLTRQKEIGYTGWDFDGGRVEANKEDNRLQIIFDDKPDEETRAELKSNGFRWAPSAGAWQRQLNDNAIYAAGKLDCIRPLSGESPSEVQNRVRVERQAEAVSAGPVSGPEGPDETEQDGGMQMC